MSDHINFKPWFQQTIVPCEGDVGDLIVITPLKEGQADGSAQGLASVWFCIKASSDKGKAVWARVQFDGVATCDDGTVQAPPQTHPTLRQG